MDVIQSSTAPSNSSATTRTSGQAHGAVPLSNPRRITIKHPGYQGNNTLLTLPACDGVRGDCAHYATIHTACSIVSGNALNGWLSTSRAGDPTIEPDLDGLVEAGIYFFHVPIGAGPEKSSCIVPYAICPNFRAWKFPHGQLPALWQEAASENTSTVHLAVQHTTETCRITDKYLACDTAHIVPTSEKSWFADNEMDQYGELGGRTGQDVADCSSNLIQLRRDVHYLWDSFYFSIIPKKTPKDDGIITWRTHSMSEHLEILEDIHNKTTQPLSGRRVEYLFARFAWDLFPKIFGFLQSSQQRRLAVRQADGEVGVKFYSAVECRSFAEGQGRGRSASPTKRSRKADAESHADTIESDINHNIKRRRSTSTGFENADSGVSDMSQDSPTDHQGSPMAQSSILEAQQHVNGDGYRGRKRYRSGAWNT